jgi:hypothetical protein
VSKRTDLQRNKQHIAGIRKIVKLATGCGTSDKNTKRIQFTQS